MKIAFAEPDLGKKGALVVGVAEGRALGASAADLDSRLGGAIGRALAASRFNGKTGELLEILAPAGIPASRIILLGLGRLEDLGEGKLEDLGGGACGMLLGLGDTGAAVVIDAAGEVSAVEAAARMALGARLRAYRFGKYRKKATADTAPRLEKLTFMVAGAKAAQKSYAELEKLADGVFFARDVVTEPPNVIFPASYAERIRAEAPDGLTVEVLGMKEMRKLGMGALVGVGQGSEREPQLVVMQWQGGRKDKAPVALVGKGVTFDSGGLSLKTAKGMEDMKWDMAGSAAVVGTMFALAGRRAKVNAVGVVGLVENMPSGNAQRPGDVVTTMSGQTVEVLNTDAEGRLVLCDALWYTQDRFKPVAMINLATLTGAIITSLGHEHAGLFSNSDELSAAITEAGRKVGEPVWRMPLGDAYDKMINSDIADMKNIGDGSAGSIIGGQFLQRFVNGVPWAHLDIAGTAWSKKDQPTVPKGATAWGVRLLERLVRTHYEG